MQMHECFLVQVLCNLLVVSGSFWLCQPEVFDLQRASTRAHVASLEAHLVTPRHGCLGHLNISVWEGRVAPEIWKYALLHPLTFVPGLFLHLHNTNEW